MHARNHDEDVPVGIRFTTHALTPQREMLSGITGECDNDQRCGENNEQQSSTLSTDYEPVPVRFPLGNQNLTDEEKFFHA